MSKTTNNYSAVVMPEEFRWTPSEKSLALIEQVRNAKIRVESATTEYQKAESQLSEATEALGRWLMPHGSIMPKETNMFIRLGDELLHFRRDEYGKYNLSMMPVSNNPA